MSATPSTPSAQTLAQLVGGILGGGIRVVDLTVPLEPATPTIQLPPQFAPSKPFSLQETMLPAAALMPATLVAIERHLIDDRTKLRHHIASRSEQRHRERLIGRHERRNGTGA